MPDISMCTGGNCPKKNDCYRFRAVPNEYRQSYFAEPPYERWSRCDYFWQIETGDRLTPLAAKVADPEPPREELNNSRLGPTPDDNRVAHPVKEDKRYAHRKNWKTKT